MKQGRWFGLLLLTLIMSSGLARQVYAQGSMDNTEVYSLGEVVVTGERGGG